MNNLYPKPNSICILRLSAIGDVCHAIATVEELQRLWPETHITWVIGKVEYQLVKNMQGIQFVIFDKIRGIHSYQQLRNDMKHKQFDILLHMQIALRASIASLFISAKHRWGFHKSNCKELQWLFTNHKIQDLHQPHVAEGFWAFAQALSDHYHYDNQQHNNQQRTAKTPHWDITISPDDQAWYEQQLQQFFDEQQKGDKIKPQPFFVISPAASKASRNWLVENYAALAHHAFNQGFRVLLTGSPSAADVQLSQSIIDYYNKDGINSDRRNSIFDLTGKTTLLQLLTVLKNAAFILAPDSGPAHMASIVNTPVIGLYAHSNPDRTGPYHSLNTTVSIYKELVSKQSVKTIDKIPWGTRIKGDHLMKNISIESVIVEFDKLVHLMKNS